VKKKLDTLDELFPTERVEQSKSRIRAIWEKQIPGDRYPVTYGYALFNMYNALHSPEERLKHSLDEFLIHGRLNDDFVPALFPGCRQSTILNMFGAGEIAIGDDVICERIITTAGDIEELPVPSFAPGTVAAMWLEMQEYFLEETDGRLPVHVTDMQGPLDVCGQMMPYDTLLLMALDDPGHVHMLLEKVTDAFILLWQKQRDLLGDRFVGTHLFGHNWVPDSFGASISVDSLVMFGPEFYREFVQHYIIKIGENFGPVAVHSCGDFSANIKALCETQHVSGINAAQMDIGELLDAGLDREKVILAFATPENAADGFQHIHSESLLVDLSIDNMPWPKTDDEVTHPADWSESDWNELYRVEEKILSQASVKRVPQV